MNRRLKATFMIVVLLFGIFSNFGVQVTMAEAIGIQSIKNNIIELVVNRKDGRFAVRTMEGSPNRAEDNNVPLLFLEDIPETTFTTFRIDGKDYIYGNAYNGTMINGGIITTPIIEGMKNTSSWAIGDIIVTQKLELTDNINSSEVGNVKISYSIKNNGSKSSMVGTRILMDMMLGSNDGCSVSLNGSENVTYETQIAGEDIPVYWRCTDAVDSPKVVAYGFIKGWGNKEPDSMTIAHWSGLSSTKWDYTVNKSRNIGSSLNDYKSADSAAALYWEPETLEPGETIVVETYYGLGNISSMASDTFSMKVMAPSRLNIKGEIYENNPFEILMELDNSLEDSIGLSGINAELVLPEGLELVDDQQSSQYLYNIPVGQKRTVVWKVKALNTQKMKAVQYMIRIKSFDEEIKNIKKFIIIPGFNNEESELGYTDIVPRNLYYEDDDNTIQIMGYGFNKLLDKSSYEISLVNQKKNKIYYSEAKNITILNDNQIRIGIPKGLETGTYRIVINHQNDMLDYTLSQEITVTSDERYKSRNYGILVINENNSATIHENESSLSASDKSNSKFIIRGKVKKISEDKFDVLGDAISINNHIYYKGYDDKILSVYKDGGSYKIKGNGELYMQSALMGKSMDLTLKKGHFYIDSATSVIRGEEGYIEDVSVLYVGYFPILVKQIKIQKDGEIKVDGVLQLENKYFNFLTNIGTGLIESDLKDMSISNKKIDIDAEITIPFPRWKLGNFQSKDYMTKSTNNVTFFINTIKGAYGFKTKAQNPSLKLLDINATMGVDKNLYPDYFEFKNNYGLIPQPIGSTGLGFESIGGGLYGLKSMFDSLRHGILPTGSSIAVRADIVDLLTYHARIKEKTLLGLRDIEAVLNTGGIDLKGDAYIYFIPVGDIVGHFDFSGGYIQANMNILDILISEAYFGISQHEIKGSISAELKIPKNVWFVGGETVGGFKAGLSTKKIEGSIKVLGVGVGVEYKWGGSVSFDVASLDHMDYKGIYMAKTIDEQGRDVEISYGTNIEKVKNIPYYYDICYTGSVDKSLALGTSLYTYKVGIDTVIESAIIEMKYDSSDIPKITVKDSAGNAYDLIEDTNYRNHVIPADESSSGVEEKSLFVTIVSPDIGNWTIESDKPLIMTLYNAKEIATFNSLAASQDGDKIKVDWKLNKTDGSKVSLYLMREDGASGYIEIAKDLEGNLENYECAIPSEITSGNYRVRGEVKRDDTGFDYIDSEILEIFDAAAPVLKDGFTVEAIGNGMMKAEWDGATGADEYRIYAVDEDGNIDKTVNAMISIEGDKKETIFGGTLFDDEGNEYGWFPDRTYKFALYGIKLTGEEGFEIEHISKPIYSDEVKLPLVNPPVFTVSFSSDYGSINIEKDENDKEIHYTNVQSINYSYQADIIGDVIVYNNGVKVSETKNKDITFELQLERGSNFIEFEAIGENKDKSIRSYEFYYDDRAPDLMVNSPNSDNPIQGGNVLISGMTTADCKLYVNGIQITVEEDGSFNEEYMLSNLHRETITISAVNLAGNRTEYFTEVYNSEVDNVVRVEIMPSIQEIRVGESVQMRLYGVTKENKKVLLEGDRANWQIYNNQGTISITEGGLLTAKNVGEVVINAQYHISSDKVYEDALIIKVLPKSSNKDGNEGKYNPINSNIDNTNTDKDTDTDTNEQSLLRRILDFNANDEIIIPGLIKIKFTGNETLAEEYIEVYEIEDLLEYREKSGNKNFLSNIFDIIVAEGYEFNSPVELTMYFHKNKVKDLRRIAIYVYKEKDKTWELVGGVVDEVNSSITVRVPHFSKYAVMENSEMNIMRDMEGHWARDPVYRLIDRGIVNGIKSISGEYKYEPERNVTRAEFAKLLSLSKGYLEADEDDDLSYFADDLQIPLWARPYIKYCNKKGWISGKAIGEKVYMKPNDAITRAEAATMISRALGFVGNDKNINAAFKDKDKVPNWASAYIDQLIANKLMQGYSDGTFRPNKMITRAEAATLFDNYLKLR